MKVTIHKYLNARNSKPSVTAACNFFRNPGSIIEIDEAVAGDEIDGNAIWYYCTDDNCYYWSGGIQEQAFVLRKNFDTYSEEDQYAILRSLQNDREWNLLKHVVGYQGSGIGYKNDDPANGLALKVYVEEKQEQLAIVPKFFPYRGINVPADVKSIGLAIHHAPITFWDNFSPLPMGGTIARADSKEYGSRTIKVKKNNSSQHYLLTCFHVLLRDHIRKGVYNRTNGPLAKAQYPYIDNTPGQGTLVTDIVEGFYNAQYDFAVVALNNPDDVVNTFNRKKFNGFYSFRELRQLKGATVEMFGSTSNKTQGEVIDTDVTVTITNTNQQFTRVVLASKLSEPGDSGAPVVDSNNKLVGYILGGNSKASFIMPFHLIVFEKHYLPV